jgi:hypothetical protein
MWPSHIGESNLYHSVGWFNGNLIPKHPHRNTQNNIWPNLWAPTCQDDIKLTIIPELATVNILVLICHPSIFSPEEWELMWYGWNLQAWRVRWDTSCLTAATMIGLKWVWVHSPGMPPLSIQAECFIFINSEHIEVKGYFFPQGNFSSCGVK